MVTKEIQTKNNNKHLKERQKKNNTTNQNAFLRRNYDTKKKKQRNKLFYIQQQKRKEFSEFSLIEFTEGHPVANSRRLLNALKNHCSSVVKVS